MRVLSEQCKRIESQFRAKQLQCNSDLGCAVAVRLKHRLADAIRFISLLFSAIAIPSSAFPCHHESMRFNAAHCHASAFSDFMPYEPALSGIPPLSDARVESVIKPFRDVIGELLVSHHADIELYP